MVTRDTISRTIAMGGMVAIPAVIGFLGLIEADGIRGVVKYLSKPSERSLSDSLRELNRFLSRPEPAETSLYAQRPEGIQIKSEGLPSGRERR